MQLRAPSVLQTNMELARVKLLNQLVVRVVLTILKALQAQLQVQGAL